MAEELREPNASGEPTDGTPDEVVEAELIETEVTVEEVVEPAAPQPEPAIAPDPAEQANESLAAAAAAASASQEVPTSPVAPASTELPPPAVEPVAGEWQIEEGLATAAPQYVVVEPPQVPRPRGNRGIGALLALAGAVVYGGILVGLAYLLETIAGRPDIGFLQDWHFYLPVGVFAVAFVLLALLVNRAGWWAHTLGSLFVGLAVYFGTAGIDVLVDQWVGASVTHEFTATLLTPFVILAAIIAREVAMWWGWLIAYRGRRVTARNRADREVFERDAAEFRARYGA